MDNSSNIVINKPTKLESGVYKYNSVVIESSGTLDCIGTVQITANSFTLHDGGQIIASGSTTINAETFTKAVAS